MALKKVSPKEKTCRCRCFKHQHYISMVWTIKTKKRISVKFVKILFPKMTFFQWRRFNFFDVQRDIDKGSLATLLQVGPVSISHYLQSLGRIFRKGRFYFSIFTLSTIAAAYWDHFGLTYSNNNNQNLLIVHF